MIADSDSAGPRRRMQNHFEKKFKKIKTIFKINLETISNEKKMKIKKIRK